jgi:hypothetical protein
MSEELLRELIETVKAIFPTAQDFQVLNVDTVTVPAGSTVILTFINDTAYRITVKNFYVDALPESRYKWRIHGKEYGGNEIPNLSRGIIFNIGEGFELEITNNSTSDQNYDYVIEGWGRTEKGGKF